MLVIAALFILLQYAFLEVMTRASEAREKEMLELNMNTMMDAASNVNTKREAAYANLSDNLKAGIGMMVNYLKEFVGEDGYTGPARFPTAWWPNSGTGSCSSRRATGALKSI